MGRGYTIESYKNIINYIKAKIPKAAISGDAIVAFPGESETDYEQTLSLIDEIKFDHVNTAAYSPRPNTPAATWPRQLNEDIKVKRLREINSLVENIAKERNQRYKNTSQEILIENINPKDSSQLMGRTRTNRLTFFPRSLENGVENKLGELIKVKITNVRPFSLTAKLL